MSCAPSRQKRVVGRWADSERASNPFVPFHHLVKAQQQVWWRAGELSPLHGIGPLCHPRGVTGLGPTRSGVAFADGARTEDEL